jgi:hypothetical protein
MFTDGYLDNIDNPMRRALFVAALLGVSAAGSAAAQTGVAPGARIRVYVSTKFNSREVASASGYHVGTVGAIDSSAVTLLEEGGTEFRIPFSSIRQIDVSGGATTRGEGMRVGARKGAMLGAGTAAGAMGLLYGITKLGDLQQEEFHTDPPGRGLLRASWENVGKLGVIGAVGGALLGTAIGATGRERWHGVPLRALRLQLAPAANGGTAVSLRL